MIDGLLLFLAVSILYSFWWFDFYFIKKNISKFEIDFKNALKDNDVIIIFNAGGWGTINYKEAFDLNPFSDFITDYLSVRGLKVGIVQYFRTEDHLIGKIGYFKDYVFDFQRQAELITPIISDTNKKIILLGLSNGALIADEIMERTKNKKNVFSIEFGKPFFGIKSDNENILLINEFEDDLSNGNTWQLFKATFIFGTFKWIRNFILGEGISLGKAVNIKGHYYPLEKHKERVRVFIDKKIL